VLDSGFIIRYKTGMETTHILIVSEIKSEWWVWIIAVSLAIVVAGILAWWLTTKWLGLKKGGNDESHSPGFGLDEIRKMHHQGLISDKEYEKLRKNIYS